MFDPSEPTPSAYDIVEAHRMGYLKRAELGNDVYDVWEHPDGDLVQVRTGHRFMVPLFRGFRWP